MDGETIVYSSAEVAKMLGLAPAYMRVLLRRDPHLEPRKVGNMRVWVQEDVDRIKEWYSQHKRADQLWWQLRSRGGRFRPYNATTK